MEWKSLKFGHICERLIGFSPPIDGQIAVVSYEGLHFLSLHNPQKITHYLEFAEGKDIYDSSRQILEFDGITFPILGLFDGTPRLESAKGERLKFGSGDCFCLYSSMGQELFRYDYTDPSGDWRVITFSPDDQLILLGLPYDLEVFKRIDEPN